MSLVLRPTLFFVVRWTCFCYLKFSFRGSTNFWYFFSVAVFFLYNCVVLIVLVSLSPLLSYSRTPLHSCDRWRFNFTLLAANFTAAMEGSTTSTLNKDPKDQASQESLIGANWPLLPFPANSQNSQENQEDQESQIQPGQKTQRLFHGRASREDLRITKETVWANMPNISKGMKYCPYLRS